MEKPMTLKAEIAALREEIEKIKQQPAPPPAPPRPEQSVEQDQAARIGPDELLAAANSVIDELQQDIDKYPRLTAIAAFGLGLAVGIFAGRQSR
jgi:Tfp pilus assembly protein PilN